MASVEAKDFATAADEVMTPSNARVEMVNVGGQRVMKLTAQPRLEMVNGHQAYDWDRELRSQTYRGYSGRRNYMSP